MRYYVIINGINSLTIPGLAIKDLPPISKTLMRNQKETIDGRDGDIITELGYSAYDKALTIGLYGSYDINDIIAFFNQKGTIVFSDEPDKYYNFTILDQIDYDKLVKFRTATIRIHCQPFKYPLTETPEEMELKFVTGTGTDLTLNNTAEAKISLNLQGNTHQETTTGKNILGLTNGTYTPSQGAGTSVSVSNNIITITGTSGSATNIIDIPLLSPISSSLGTLTKSLNPTGTYTGVQTSLRGNTPNTLVGLHSSNAENKTGTIDADAYYFRIQINGGITINCTLKAQIEAGSSPTAYEPYTNGASPNPTYPQQVQVVTGDNTINITGKNLFSGFRDLDSQTYVDRVLTITGWKVPKSNYYKAIPNQSYTFSFISTQNNTRWYLQELDENYTELYSTPKNGNQTFTLHSETKYFSILFNLGNPSSINYPVTISNIQLELGTTATEYTPYQSQEYEINLGTLELCKIETYQDYLYKSGENWYKHTEIGKYIANNDLTDNGAISTNVPMLTPVLGAMPNISTNLLSNLMYQTASGDTRLGGTTGTGKARVYLSTTYANTLANANTYLKNNNFIIYFPLATPTEEQITNAELIEQLNAILNAVSYEDQTNISQENDNMPFIIWAIALRKGSNEAVINNIGNTVSKPTISITGSGILEIYLNGTQMLSVDMSSDTNIVIDTQNLEAYNPTTMQLKNRKVTGDYSKFVLPPGNSTIKVTGYFTNVTITNYTRWL